MLDRWASRVPGNLPVGLEIAEASTDGSPTSPTLVLSLVSSEPLVAPDVFPEGPDGLSFGKPEISLTSDRRSAELRIPVAVHGDARLSRAMLDLTVVDGARFVQKPVTVDAMPAAAAGQASAGASAATWVAMLGAALLGGLILNLMPCVLPVLSLKLLAAVGYGGAERWAIRRGFLASAAGIVASFLLLAAGAATLKSAGVAVGWGMQFQQPMFLAGMATLVVLFAANLWGLFELPLPRAIADLGAQLPRDSAAGGSLSGHFLTGAFATLLATPCSAPFLGTAVGFALAGGPVEIAAVFAAMGVGLALPYLAVAAVPDLARALPRPGSWMTGLRRALAIALALTALWLLSVLAAQAGLAAALTIAGSYVVLGLVLAMPGGRRLAVPAGALAAVVALVVTWGVDQGSPAGGPVAGQSASGAASTWVRFDPALIATLVGDGKVVLVDVTADWCLTCRVNKAAVLDRDPVAALLADGSVTGVRADWTSPDPVIADYLAGFGRYGIPFNAVYGPAAADGIPLPELLTDAAVLTAIRQAAGEAPTARLD